MVQSWLKREIEDRGRGAKAALARAIELTPDQVSKILSGERALSAEEFIRAVSHLSSAPDKLLTSLRISGALPSRQQTEISGDIPQFNIHAGMGNGGTLSVLLDETGHSLNPDETDGFWALPPTVKAGRDLRSLYALPVKGDSMEPTFTDGGFVFVDVAHNVPSPPDVYAVDYGDGLMIKRLEMIPQSASVRVISDNPRYGDYELTRDTVLVFGRVVGHFAWR